MYNTQIKLIESELNVTYTVAAHLHYKMLDLELSMTDHHDIVNNAKQLHSLIY
jgi:hypothetical protein